MTEEIVQDVTPPKRRTRKPTNKAKTTRTETKAPQGRSRTRKSSTSKTKAKPATKAAIKTKITPEEKYRMIAETAYYIAEKRGFVGGNPEEDWLEAETQVEEFLEKA